MIHNIFQLVDYNGKVAIEYIFNFPNEPKQCKRYKVTKLFATDYDYLLGRYPNNVINNRLEYNGSYNPSNFIPFWVDTTELECVEVVTPIAKPKVKRRKMPKYHEYKVVDYAYKEGQWQESVTYEPFTDDDYGV